MHKALKDSTNEIGSNIGLFANRANPAYQFYTSYADGAAFTVTTVTPFAIRFVHCWAHDLSIAGPV